LKDESGLPGPLSQNHAGDAPNDTAFAVARPPALAIIFPIEEPPRLRIYSWDKDSRGAEARVRDWVESNRELRAIVAATRRFAARQDVV
jgi:hypothetical protein